MRIGPIVTNADRDWALKKCPPWMRMEPPKDAEFVGEIVDDRAWLDVDKKADIKPPCWTEFVIEQIERFERYFAGQQKTRAEWSTLWRKTWWPKSDPARRFPKSAPKVPIPHFRAGTPEFARALAVATKTERMIWKRYGVAHFAPGDKRLKGVILEAIQ